MSRKIDTCAMPDCHEPTENGKRICARHAISGKDLRIPIYVINLGLDKIYETLRKQKQGFSVETILDILDPGYADRIDGANCKNALAKLFRSLRANKFLTKKGHVNGFVVYELGEGWKQNYVFIEDEPPTSKDKTVSDVAHINKQLYNFAEQEIKPLKLENTHIKKQVEDLTKKMDAIEEQFLMFLSEQKEAIIAIQKNIDILAVRINKDTHNSQAELKEQIAMLEEKVKLLSQNKQDCPVAKLREQMHIMFGGKRSETKL